MERNISHNSIFFFLLKINWGESFLDLTLEYLPNDDLLSILKREQLPKLKSLFDMSMQPTMRKKSQHTSHTPHANGGNYSHQLNNQLGIDSTPKSSKQTFSLK